MGERPSLMRMGNTCTALALVLLLLSACGDASGRATDGIERGVSDVATDQPTDCQPYSVDQYPLSEDPESAIAFIGNPEIFEATVEQAEPATMALQPERNVPVLVYVPVHVTVTRVYKGSASVGAKVVLRDLGGTAADCTTFLIASVPDSVWVPGTKIFVFANRATSPEGKTALTPNWVFLEEGGLARSSVDPDLTMDLPLMRSSVAKRWPRS